MAVYVANSVTELYDVVGYWSDAGASRVAGTAVSGDIVLASFTGTNDRGATDNILYPAVGVRIKGPGSGKLTVQGRLRVHGTGGAAVVTRIDGLTFDQKGYAAVDINNGDGTYDGYGGFTFQRASVYCLDCVFTNSAPASGNGNLVTVCSPASVSAIKCVFESCTFSSSYADGFSTKSSTAAAGNLATAVYLINCIGITPGAGSIDEPATCHDAVKLIIIGGYYEGGATYKLAIVADVDATPLEVYDAYVKGVLYGADVVSGCLVDGNAGHASFPGTITAEAATISHTRITNCLNTTSGCGIVIPSTTAVDTTLSYVDCTGGANTAGVQVNATHTKKILADHFIASGCRRGLDLRYTTGAGVVTDSVIACSNYSILGPDATHPTTARNTVDADYYNTTKAGTDTLVATGAIPAGTFTTARSAIKVFGSPITPNWVQIRDELLAGGGWPVGRVQKGSFMGVGL